MFNCALPLSFQFSLPDTTAFWTAFDSLGKKKRIKLKFISANWLSGNRPSAVIKKSKKGFLLWGFDT